MKMSLQSYFDLGASYGLGDDIFRRSSATSGPDASATVLDIPAIGIRNPLGLGVVCQLDNQHAEIMNEWRAAAVRKVDMPEMELGYDDDPNSSGQIEEIRFSDFKEQLKGHIHEHGIEGCTLTVYAIGTVFLRLDFASGLPIEFLRGFTRCFEYAAYEEHTSQGLLRVARQTMESAIRGQNSGIQELSRRPDPAIEIDEHGNSESDLLYAGFTYVALCVDEGDKVETVKQKLLPPVPGAPQRQYEVLSFEFHGTLHFDWASCILVARSFDDPSEDPMTQIQRMLYCIQIAHSYLGTCVAFEDLFFHETLRQADGYVKGIPGGRDPRELNRLRTLALAVVSLTSYAAITATEEDQSYFDCYERHAKIRERHQIIQDRCEILLNVQVAETQSEEAKRQQLLNGVVLFLTAFTFLSVFADSYTFLQEGEHWLPHLLHRVVVLGSVLVLLVWATWAILKRSILPDLGRRGNT
jgi:hypothetical protein